MKKGTWRWRVAAVALTLAVNCIGSAQSEQKHYHPRVLFSVPYGAGPGEIGIRPAAGDEASGDPMSLIGLRVPAEDMLFVMDAVQNRIKRFDRAGNVTVIIDSAYKEIDVEGRPHIMRALEFLSDFAATPGGVVIAALGGGPRGRVEVFTPTGLPLPDGWHALAAQVQAQVSSKWGSPEIPLVHADQFGDFYLHVSPVATEYGMALFKFDADLALRAVLPGFRVGWDGRTYGFVPTREPEPNHRLRMWSPEGELESTVTLRPPAEISAGDYDAASGRWHAVSGMLFDARGGIYMVYTSRRPRAQWVSLMPDFTITEDISVYKFDSSGNFLLKLVVDGLPFFMEPPLAVDPDGNIYHLLYYADHVHFVQQQLTDGGAAAPGGEVRWVGVREELEAKGWRVSWDPAGRRATAQRGRTTAAVVIGESRAWINGRAVPLPAPVRLEAGRIRAPESLLAQLTYREQEPRRWARLAVQRIMDAVYPSAAESRWAQPE